MFRIERSGPSQSLARVLASDRLDVADFRSIAQELGVPAVKARKTGSVAAHQTREGQRVETRWNGTESVADAVPGDWIVTSLGSDGTPLRDRDGSANIYVIREAKFPELYQPVGTNGALGAVFQPKGVVEALRLEGGFEIMAPWGELQRADDGWLLLNGAEVYGNHRDTFAATYEIIR